MQHESTVLGATLFAFQAAVAARRKIPADAVESSTARYSQTRTNTLEFHGAQRIYRLCNYSASTATELSSGVLFHEQLRRPGRSHSLLALGDRLERDAGDYEDGRDCAHNNRNLSTIQGVQGLGAV